MMIGASAKIISPAIIGNLWIKGAITEVDVEMLYSRLPEISSCQ